MFKSDYGAKIMENRKSEIIKILKQNGINLKFVEKEFRDDVDVNLTAVKESLCALQYVDSSLSKNEEFIYRGITETSWALFIYKFASKKIRNNEKILIEALKRDGEAIAFANKEFSERKDLARIALNARRNANLQHFSDKVRGDREFMLEVLKDYTHQLLYLTPDLKSDIDFMSKVVEANPSIEKYISKDLAKAIKNNLQLQSDKEIAD